jgi:hypothetical protein
VARLGSCAVARLTACRKVIRKSAWRSLARFMLDMIESPQRIDERTVLELAELVLAIVGEGKPGSRMALPAAHP